MTPANPADVDLSHLEPGEPVLLRGLGLNFFDYMALLSVGRGGEFVTEDGTLSYRPSGREPRMFACLPARGAHTTPAARTRRASTAATSRGCSPRR